MTNAKTEFVVKVEVPDDVVLSAFEEILKSNLLVVVQTGKGYNRDPPRMGWIRAFYSVVMEAKDRG